MSVIANKKLLIIEDDIAFATTLKNNLRRREMLVEHAEDGEAALALCVSFKPDFILLDLKIGSESGLQLIEPIRAQLPAVRMVLLTGFASIATAVDAIKKGADDYLPKPTNINAILLALTGETVDAEAEIPDAPMSPARLEWEHLQKTLRENNGNVSMTARVLGLHRRTLQRKLEKKPNSR